MNVETMKAVRCSHGHVHVEQVPRPTGDGVRVKVRSAGICGSDLHMLNIGFPLESTLGHEIAGVTDNGTAVAIEPMANCGHCHYCTRGEPNHCVKGPGMVIGVGLDGGMAEELVVPETCLVPLPSGLAVSDANLVEPVSVAVHGIAMAGLFPGIQVAIVGGGTIGLCAAAALRECIKSPYVVARHDAQRRAAEQLGAVLEPGSDYDLVIDCAGTSESLSEAARLCRPKGTLLLLATYWEGVQMPAMEICMKELHLIGASMHGRQGLARDMDVAASLLARQPDIPGILISHRLPLDAAPEAFSVAADRAGGAIKVALEP